MFLVGPALHTWYTALSKMVTAGGLTGGLMKMACDQLLFAPFFVGTFISSLLVINVSAAAATAAAAAAACTETGAAL